MTLHPDQKARFTILTLLVILVLSPAYSHPVQPIQDNLSPESARFQLSQQARSSTTYTYDEQVGITLTQDFNGLAFNVTAVAQTGADGAGPAYLVNGLTNTGFWYQVGVSYNWPNLSGGHVSGFSMNYEVFAPPSYPTSCASGSIFPSNCGGGLAPFSVNPGDTVLLSLNFTSGLVIMLAHDWNTGSTLSQQYNAEGGSFFKGLLDASAQNGFFSGLMTEQYHSSPYYGTGQPVLYSENQSALSSAWMWMDEFNSATGVGQFFAQTSSPVAFSDLTVLRYFSSNGTAEAGGPNELATGLSPVSLPTLDPVPLTRGYPGQAATISLVLGNVTQVTTRISGLTIRSDLGTFTPPTGIPFNLSSGKTTFNTTIILPENAAIGNHTLLVTVSWQFLESGIPAWVQPQSLETTVTLQVVQGSNPNPSPPTSSGPSPPGPSSHGPTTPTGTTTPKQQTITTLLAQAFRATLVFGSLAYIVLLLLAATLLVNARQSPRLPGLGPNLRPCLGCGTPVNQTLLFCPTCGRPVIEAVNRPPDGSVTS